MYIFAGIGSMLIALVVSCGLLPLYIFRKKIVGVIKGWFSRSKKQVVSETHQGK